MGAKRTKFKFKLEKDKNEMNTNRKQGEAKTALSCTGVTKFSLGKWCILMFLIAVGMLLIFFLMDQRYQSTAVWIYTEVPILPIPNVSI